MCVIGPNTNMHTHAFDYMHLHANIHKGYGTSFSCLMPEVPNGRVIHKICCRVAIPVFQTKAKFTHVKVYYRLQ